MRIERLKIRNFRSLKSLDLEIPQICALVGPNSSGKSNILRAIKLALVQDWVRTDSLQDSDRWLGDPTNNVSITVKFSEPVDYKKFKYQTPVKIHGICYQFGHKANGEPALSSTCLDVKGEVAVGPLQAPKTGKGAENKFGPILEVPDDVRDAVPTIYIGTDRSMKDQLPDKKLSMLRRMLRDVEEELQSPKCTIDVKHEDGRIIQKPRQQHFRTLMAEAMKTLRTSRFEAMETSIRQHILENLGMDPVEDAEKLVFHFDPLDPMDFFKALDLRVTDDSGFQARASDLGDGVQNAMVLAILRTYEALRKKGAIFLIEEPEMFLHPQMQRSLYKTLREIGKNNQVIYTTHSPHFVSIPEYFDVLVVSKNEEGTQVTASDLIPEPWRLEKFRKELDPERSELFFSQRVLFVEGDTEKLALPEFATRMGLDLDRAGATIVEVGGKKSLKAMAEMALSFGIPTGILFDQDSGDFKPKEKAQEENYNDELLALVQKSSAHAGWMMEKDYETMLRKSLGEELYQTLCQDHPNKSKAIQGRLVASDHRTTIPPLIDEALRWLMGQPKAIGAAS